MSTAIDAIYEKGVFKPIEHIKLREYQQVQVIINSFDATKWESEFKTLLEEIHRHTIKFSSTKIEDDITFASKELKEEYCAKTGLS